MSFPAFRVIVFMLIAGYLFMFSSTAAAQSSTATAADGCCQDLQKPVHPSAEAFEKAKDCFFAAHGYDQFVACLGRIAEQDGPSNPYVSYYTALARYQQLKHFEEQQLWNEYFSQGNTYRDEIKVYLERVLSAAGPGDSLGIRAGLLLWQFHKDQEDVFAEAALSGLMARIDAYAANPSVDMQPVKAVADTLLAYAMKPQARKLYALYIEKSAVSRKGIDEMEAMAALFLKEGNLEFAETVYDALIKGLSQTFSKQETLATLERIARQFAYGGTAATDPAYAEKIFSEMEAVGGAGAFDENLLYLRAFNLEKYRDFAAARRIYDVFIGRFPQSPRINRAVFKSAVLSLYALRDIAAAKENLRKLSEQETASPEVIAGLYHLGLVSQWEGDPAQARACYEKLREKAKADFPQTVASVQERMDEIVSGQPLAHGVRTFLDVSLKPEHESFAMSRVEIKVEPAAARKNEQIKVQASALAPESGCMQVSLDYLWALDLGTAMPLAQDASFSTSFEEAGPKIVGLIVTTSGGNILDRSINFIDIE